MNALPTFTYAPSGHRGWPGWLRFKFKECWILVRLLLEAWPPSERAVVLHNSFTGQHFTDAFLDHKAMEAEPALAGATKITPSSGVSAAFALVPALLLTCLPVPVLCRVSRALLRRRAFAVIYCDAQLSGFVLALAYRLQGTPTATLHHGLYQHDHSVSMVGIANFVADRAFLWNEVTREAFLRGGVDEERIQVVGQYGWRVRSASKAVTEPRRIHLCPPFDEAELPLYQQISKVLAPAWKTGFSLHPLLRARHAALEPQAIATLSPAPAAAICGDSGAIMDCLARHIPVVTIGGRNLATTHFRPDEAEGMTSDEWRSAIERATQSLPRDRARFGFVDTGISMHDRSKETMSARTNASNQGT